LTKAFGLNQIQGFMMNAIGRALRILFGMIVAPMVGLAVLVVLAFLLPCGVLLLDADGFAAFLGTTLSCSIVAESVMAPALMLGMTFSMLVGLVLVATYVSAFALGLPLLIWARYRHAVPGLSFALASGTFVFFATSAFWLRTELGSILPFALFVAGALAGATFWWIALKGNVFFARPAALPAKKSAVYLVSGVALLASGIFFFREPAVKAVPVGEETSRPVERRSWNDQNHSIVIENRLQQPLRIERGGVISCNGTSGDISPAAVIDISPGEKKVVLSGCRLRKGWRVRVAGNEKPEFSGNNACYVIENSLQIAIQGTQDRLSFAIDDPENGLPIAPDDDQDLQEETSRMVIWSSIASSEASLCDLSASP
jgi:hypothetical protein